jgi:hypothetical protein
MAGILVDRVETRANRDRGSAADDEPLGGQLVRAQVPAQRPVLDA